MKIGKVSCQDIRIVMRLDGSFHLAEANIYEKTILKREHRLLDSFCDDIFTSGRSKRFYTTKERGYPYLSNSDVIAQNPFASCKYYSRKYAYDDDALLKKGMILTGRVGAIGQTAYVTDEFEEKKAMGSDNIIRIVPKKNEYGGFLYAFLASEIGNKLLWKLATGGVQPYITDGMLANIPVPIFPEEKQEQIHNLITEAAQLRVEANRLLEEAVEMFENEIGVSTYQYSYRTNKINISQINTWQCRFDAQYQIAKNEIKKEKTTHKHIQIKECADMIFTGNRSKRNYVADGIPFLSSSDMLLFNPKRFTKQISKNSNNLTELLVSEKDILISRSGTVGNTVIVGTDLTGVAVSEHALRLVINKDVIEPEYVFCYLNTKQGKNILEATAYGSVIITLNEDYIGNINLPLIDDKVRSKIVLSINQYLTKMDKATNNENQAISLVENEIALWQS